jgi:hypothetical protein
MRIIQILLKVSPPQKNTAAKSLTESKTYAHGGRVMAVAVTPASFTVHGHHRPALRAVV